jgi:hypothetical protein
MCERDKPKAPSQPLSEGILESVTARKQEKRYTFMPDLAPEELQQRRDAADAMMQEFKRKIAAKLRQGSAPPSKKP